MAREGFSEVQSLMNASTEKRHGTEKRHSTRIPLDYKNSGILRQSIANYQRQPTSIQEEIVTLEQAIVQLKTYTSAVPTTLPVEDEQMHGIERYMRSIGCNACKVRSKLKHLEPRCESTTNVECSQSTMQRRGSYYNTRYTQYNTLAVTVYNALALYKETIDIYYNKLVSHSQHRPMSYWVVAEDEDDSAAETPLVGSDLASSVLKMKQKLSLQEHDISEREKRIREWHKLLSSTFHSRFESDDDTSSSSSPPSYDIEAGLVKVHEYATTESKKKLKQNSISAKKVGLAMLLTIALVIVLVGVVAVVLYYHSGFLTLHNQNVTAIDDNSTQDIKATIIHEKVTSSTVLVNNLTLSKVTYAEATPTSKKTITNIAMDLSTAPVLPDHTTSKLDTSTVTTIERLAETTGWSTTSTENVYHSETVGYATTTSTLEKTSNVTTARDWSSAPTNESSNIIGESSTNGNDNNSLDPKDVTTIEPNSTTPTTPLASIQNFPAAVTNVTLNDITAATNQSEVIQDTTTTPFITVTQVLSAAIDRENNAESTILDGTKPTGHFSMAENRTESTSPTTSITT